MILKPKELIEDCKKQIKDFTDIAVIGLSGGADSTLVTILCTLALGKRNVHGILLPLNEENPDIIKFTDQLGIIRETKYIENIIDFFKPYFSNNKRLFGNISSRVRMIYLYAICEELTYIENVEAKNNKKVRVIGTDNYSENFLGYFTKYGNGGVDINPIKELYKSEVYQLLDYFKEQGIITEECINRVPSTGLWEEQTDEEELGMSYDEIEQGIRFCETDFLKKDLLKYSKEQLEKNRGASTAASAS